MTSKKIVVIPNEMRNRIKTTENSVFLRYLTFARYDEQTTAFNAVLRCFAHIQVPIKTD